MAALSPEPGSRVAAPPRALALPAASAELGGHVAAHLTQLLRAELVGCMGRVLSKHSRHQIRTMSTRHWTSTLPPAPHSMLRAETPSAGSRDATVPSGSQTRGDEHLVPKAPRPIRASRSWAVTPWARDSLSGIAGVGGAL